MMMNKISLQNSLVFIFCIIANGCGDVRTESNVTESIQSSNDTSCVIALSSHAGEKQSDIDIQKYQKASTGDGIKVNQLENLGWAYVNKAKESFDPGFYKLAEQTVVCMNQHQETTLAALLLQGHILQNLHRFKQAEVIARQLVEKRGYWHDYGLLGDTLMEQGELTAAITAYQEMMNQNPGPQAYNRAAYIRWLTGDVEGAIELLNLSVRSHAGKNNNSLAWTLTRIADYQFQSGRIDFGLKYINAVLRKQPDYAPALLVQGRIKMALGLNEKAVAIFSRALELNPLPEYRWELIEALSNDDGTQETRAKLELKLFQTGAVEDKRTYALYLANFGIDTEKAVQLAKQEIENRHDVFTLDTLAWALRSNNQLEAAKSYSKQALKEGTRSARLYYHAAVIASEVGEKPEAKRLFQLAKELEISLLPSERKHLNQLL